MFGFDSKDSLFGFSLVFLVLKWKKPTLVFFKTILNWMDIKNQNLKIPNKLKLFLFLRLFNAENQTENVEKKTWVVCCFLRSWLIISIQKTKKNVVLGFPFQNQKTTKKTRDTQKKHRLSQNQTFSQKFFFCFFWFCLSFLFFQVLLLFSMRPKLFELQVPSSGPAQRVKYVFS